MNEAADYKTRFCEGDIDPIALIKKYRKELMGFASLWILLYHYWRPLFESIYGLKQIENIIIGFGFSGVDIFLFLSGLGLYYSIRKNSLGSFYQHRFSRILPTFILLSGLYSVMLGESLLAFLKKIIGWNFFTISTFNGYWYPTFILIVYLLFPLYYLMFDRSRSKPQFFLFTVLFIVILVALEDYIRYDFYICIQRLPIFALGVLAAWAAENATLRFKPWHYLIFVPVLLASMVLEFFCYFKGMLAEVPFFICGPPAFLLAVTIMLLLSFLFEKMQRPIGRAVKKALAFIGVISFEFYLIQSLTQFVVLPGFEAYGGDLLDNFFLIVINTVLAYSVSLVCMLLRKLVTLIVNVFNKSVKAQT